MLYPKRSMEKSPSAAMITPAAVNNTERVTCNKDGQKTALKSLG